MSTTLVNAARTALDKALTNDERVVVLGEDVTAGGAFGVTKDLVERHGAARIRNTPICEASFMGAGIGMALGGARPFVDIMFDDFITVASDQLFNHAAKIHFMSGGRYSVPLTTWTVAGGGTAWGAHHSQRLDGLLAQIPGLKVLAPSSPAMAAASVTAALDDPDPVVIVADRALLYSRAPLPGDDGSPWQPRVVRTGTELTLVASGRLVHAAIEAAERSGRSVEVVDLQRVAPLDVTVIAASAEKTTRVLIAHDEAGNGVSSLVESALYERCFWALDTPIRRLTAPPTPVPAAPELEAAHLVSVADLERAIGEVCAA